MKNANEEGAIGVWESENGIQIAFNVTAPGSVILNANGEQMTYDAVPGEVYTYETSIVSSVDDVQVCLSDAEGMEGNRKHTPLGRRKPVEPLHHCLRPLL